MQLDRKSYSNIRKRMMAMTPPPKTAASRHTIVFAGDLNLLFLVRGTNSSRVVPFQLATVSL